MSSLSGSLMIDAFGIKTVAPNCNWDNLWLLVLIGHILMPLIVSVSASFLIPNVKQTEKLDGQGNVVRDD